MADTIPPDTRAVGDTGHVGDHNNMADVLSLLTQVLAQSAQTFTSSNTAAVTSVQGLQSSNWELQPVVGYAPVGASVARTSTSILADPNLQVSVQASAVYRVECYIQYNGGASGSAGFLQWNFSVPTGSSGQFYYNAVYKSNTGSLLQQALQDNSSGVFAFTNGVTTPLTMEMNGVLITGANNGTFSFNWGCQTNTGTNTHVTAGSMLSATRVA